MRTGEIKLYEISGAMKVALDNVCIDEETGEIFGGDAVRELSDVCTDKLLNAAKYSATLGAQIAALKAQKDNISARIKSAERVSAWLNGLIQQGMTALDSRKLSDDSIVVSLRKAPASVEVYDEAAVGIEYKVEKITYSIDKTRIKAALKAGQEVPGCCLKQGEYLSIK